MYLWKEIFFLFWTYYSDQVSLIDIVKVSCVVCLYLLGIWNWSYFFFLILVYMSYAVMWEKKKSRWCNHKKKSFVILIRSLNRREGSDINKRGTLRRRKKSSDFSVPFFLCLSPSLSCAIGSKNWFPTATTRSILYRHKLSCKRFVFP